MTLPFLLMYESISRRMRLRAILSLAVVTLLSSGYYNAFSQVQPYQYSIEVTYALTFQPDSTDPQSVEHEYMSLFVGKSQSLFCASKYLVMDSAVTAEVSRGNTLGPSMAFFEANGTHNRTVIFKTGNEIITYDKSARFMPDVYRYVEPYKFKWRILPDTMSIGAVLCQRAETTFGNRKWIAWFAPDIPISDGPYKFGGLPGLIMSISDAGQYWNFRLVRLKNRDTTLAVNFLNRTPQPIKSKEDFFRLKAFQRDNRFQLMKASGAVFSNEAKFIKGYQERARKDNNWIELYRNDSQ